MRPIWCGWRWIRCQSLSWIDPILSLLVEIDADRERHRRRRHFPPEKHLIPELPYPDTLRIFTMWQLLWENCHRAFSQNILGLLKSQFILIKKIFIMILMFVTFRTSLWSTGGAFRLVRIQVRVCLWPETFPSHHGAKLHRQVLPACPTTHQVWRPGCPHRCKYFLPSEKIRQGF